MNAADRSFIPAPNLHHANYHRKLLEFERATLNALKSPIPIAQKRRALEDFRVFVFREVEHQMRVLAAITPIIQACGAFWVDSRMPTSDSDSTMAIATIFLDPRSYEKQSQRPEQIRWPYLEMRYGLGFTIDLRLPTAYAFAGLASASEVQPRLFDEFARVTKAELQTGKRRHAVDPNKSFRLQITQATDKIGFEPQRSAAVRRDLPFVWFPGTNDLTVPQMLRAGLALIETIEITRHPERMLGRSTVHPLEEIIAMVDDFQQQYRSTSRRGISRRIGYDSDTDLA